jgi:hypothetical protein
MKSTIMKSSLLTAWLVCCLWASLAFSAGTTQPSATKSAGSPRGGSGSPSGGGRGGALPLDASDPSGGFGSSFGGGRGGGGVSSGGLGSSFPGGLGGLGGSMTAMRMTFDSMTDELKKTAYAGKPAFPFPKRELKFDVAEEEVPIELFAVDTKLLEQRHVVVFRIVVPGRYPTPGVPESLLFLYRICYFQLSEPSARVFKALGDNTPPERLPAKDILAALTTEGMSHVHSRNVTERSSWPLSQDASVSFGSPQTQPTRAESTLEYQIFAPTVERAKELVEGMLSLQDNGLFSPIQQELLGAKRKFEGNLQESGANLAKTQMALKACREQVDAMKEFADIGEQTLSGLETQQRLIEVDMEGVKARIKACNDLLETSKKSSPYSPSRVEQLENLKIAAEVELAGLMARRASIQQFIANVHKCNKMQVELAQLNRDIRISENNISIAQNRISEIEMDMKDFAQVRVENNLVRIRRVKWESPKKEQPNAAAKTSP